MVSRSGGRNVDRQAPGVAELAVALGVLDRIEHGGAVADGVVRAAHDALYSSAQRRNGDVCLRRLAQLLVGRGVVPGPGEYQGLWWLWWPKDGHGPCGGCGKTRVLKRYSGRLHRPYRYRCARCRADERVQDAEQAQELFEQLGAKLGGAAPTAVPATGGGGQTGPGPTVRPADGAWAGHLERLCDLLSSLDWAGFDLPEEWECEYDPQVGALLFADIWRGDGGISVQYEPDAGMLALQPFEDVAGDCPLSYSLIEDSIRIPVAGTGSGAAAAVARAVGQAGLLDATHVRIADGTPPGAAREFAYHRVRRIFQPAADFRELPLAQVLRQVTEDSSLAAYLEWVVDMAGGDVAPDVVPDAAALGVAAWCWRNNTAVEAHHLDSDVLMARVNMAVTRITMQHVDPVLGIDWDGIGSALADPAWALPDGRTIRSLFGAGWSEVAATVTAELARWRHLDYEVLGPRTVLILMTIGGSTSYTSSWWGQGRWAGMCRRVIDDATTAGLALPSPYDSRGEDALLADLEAPDRLPDHVLDWLIDLPQSRADGPHGLRFHAVTRPAQRCWDPYWLTEPAQQPGLPGQ
jgi:hypothetical protein